MHRDNTLRPEGDVQMTRYVVSNRSDKHPDGYVIYEVFKFASGWWINREKHSRSYDGALKLLPVGSKLVWATNSSDLIQYESWEKPT